MNRSQLPPCDASEISPDRRSMRPCRRAAVFIVWDGEDGEVDDDRTWLLCQAHADTPHRRCFWAGPHRR